MKKILIVDDEVEIREIYEDFIRNSLGREDLFFFQDGIEALVSCTKEKFDLIILDHKLPRLDGFQLLLLLRRIAGPSQKSPVIFISGNFPDAYNERLFENTYSLDKPIDYVKLEKLIKSALKI